MATKRGKVVTHCQGLRPINSYKPLNMYWEEVTWKLETYLHYHNAYGHKTYQFGDIPQGIPMNNFPWPLNEMFIEATWQIKYNMSLPAEEPCAPN